MNKESKLLLIIFVIALIIRLAFGFYDYHQNGPSTWNDALAYIEYADNIIEQGLSVPDIEYMHRPDYPIGYPMILAFLFTIFGKAYIPAIILNAFLSALTSIVIYFLGKKLFNNRVALYSAIWSISFIFFIRYTGVLIKENTILFFFSVSILFLLYTIEKKNIFSLYSFLLTLTFVVLIHLDERFFIYFPLLGLILIFLDKFSWKKGLSKSILFTGLVIILSVPWFIRNYRVYKRPVILTERTTKLTDKILNYNEVVEQRQIKSRKRIEIYEAVTDSIIKGYKIKSDVPRLSGLRKGIKSGHIPHTFNKLERYWAEFKEFWRPVRFSAGYVGSGYRYEGPSWSLKHNITQGLTYGLLLPFFLIGLYFIFKYRNKHGLMLFLVIITHTIIHVILDHVRNRYRLPIDPFIIIISFYGLTNLFPRLKIEKLI